MSRAPRRKQAKVEGEGGLALLSGRFAVQDLLGSGGMASVFRAWDRVLRRPCAVKVLSDVLSRDEEFRRRFRREAEAARGLAHPNIIAVYECGDAGPQHYMAMEYVAGGTLRDALHRRGAFSEADALRIASEVADALAYAHGRGVVHRDIKPHNVLLTEDGHVKVADFGIARTRDATSLTRTGSLLGSAQYISPEQARGDQAGPASDLYALGVVLFEMLAGRVPFDGEAPVAIALKHLHDPPPDLRPIRPDISEATIAVVQRLLAKAVGNRYPTAAALAADLRRIASELPRRRSAGDPASSPEAARETARRPGVSTVAADTGDMLEATALLAAPAALAELGDSPDSTARLSVGRPPGEEVQPVATADAIPTGALPALREGSVADTARFEVPAPLRSRTSPKMRLPAHAKIRLTVPANMRLTMLAVAGVLVVGLVDSAYWATWIAAHVLVPPLVGRTVAAAAQTVLPLRLGVVIVSEKQDPRIRSGLILTQDPPAGLQVLKGTVIRVTVSGGSGVVPDLRGLPLSSAPARLEAAGLRLGRVSYISDSRDAPGTVIDQDQPPGTSLAPDAAVGILVSQGSPPVLVPFQRAPWLGPHASLDTRK